MSKHHWAHLRAALISLHLVAILLMALPNPSAGLQRSAWKDPTVQAEFAIWRARLSGVGIDMEPAEFEAKLWDFASGYYDIRRDVLAPFDPYYRYFGTWQSWRMFVAPHRYPARFEIDIQGQSGAWQHLYVARSNEYEWNRAQFDHERFRAAVFRYGWPNYRSTLYQLGDWTATRVFTEYPHAEAIRVRFYKYQTPSPTEVVRGDRVDGKYVNARIFRRKKP